MTVYEECRSLGSIQVSKTLLFEANSSLGISQSLARAILEIFVFINLEVLRMILRCKGILILAQGVLEVV